MARQRPEQAVQRVTMATARRSDPDPEALAARDQRRKMAALQGPAMRAVLEAVIAAGGQIEVETETHVLILQAIER